MSQDELSAEINQLKETAIPDAQKIVDGLKTKARNKLTVTVAEGVGLIEEGAFGGSMDSYVQITLAALEYPKGDYTEKRIATLEGGGTHPKWNESLEFEEIEDDGLLIVEVFESDCGTENLLVRTLLSRLAHALLTLVSRFPTLYDDSRWLSRPRRR